MYWVCWKGGGSTCKLCVPVLSAQSNCTAPFKAALKPAWGFDFLCICKERILVWEEWIPLQHGLCHALRQAAQLGVAQEWCRRCWAAADPAPWLRFNNGIYEYFYIRHTFFNVTWCLSRPGCSARERWAGGRACPVLCSMASLAFLGLRAPSNAHLSLWGTHQHLIGGKGTSTGSLGWRKAARAPGWGAGFETLAGDDGSACFSIGKCLGFLWWESHK